MKNIVFTLFVLAMLLVSIGGSFAAPPIGRYNNQSEPELQGVIDDRPDPLSLKQRDMRQNALEEKLKGKAYGRTHEVARGQFVELTREGESPVWTVLGEFSDLAHNQITQPDRNFDNTTIWVPDFNRNYYMNMLFSEAPGTNSMRNYFIEQSSNRYTVSGDVTGWVQLPGKACDYDDGDPGPGDANHVWQFLIDSVNAWYDNQINAGKTPEEINTYLSQLDVWDPYDYDGDGNFDEPDGYIDHIQFVHAGIGNEAGGGVLEDCAIWSHSWYAYYTLIGITGPDFNKAGGIRIGNSNYWVGKYTIQPENGGVGVFAHEFSHDLGLPDLYDTSGPIQLGDNSTGFWTLMSSGNWLSDGTIDVGSKPSHLGAWEKLQLGWLNYEVAFAGKKSEHKLGPMETNTKQAQGLFVILPQKSVTEHIADPYAGSYFYFSGSANNLRNQMTKAFTLGAGTTLAAKVNYGIEVGYDYANVIASTDGGATWQTVPTNLSNSTIEPNGIDGFSSGWVDLTANLSAYGGNVLLGFRYTSDAGVNYDGFMIDDIQISGYALDGGETEAGWTYAGFRRTTGTEEKLYNHYYVAEFRQYRGYDDTLRVGPYNFGFLNNSELQNYVERFPYQDGLLINYWDTSQKDNRVRVHPGKGLLLPIDAHPEVMYRADGGIWHNRMQTYDSTFCLDPTDAITLHWGSQLSYHPSQPAAPVFDDRIQYYRTENPWGGVINPNTGTQIRIKSVSALDGFMQVEVRPAK